MEKRKPEIAARKELEESRKKIRGLKKDCRGDMCDVTKRFGEAIENTKNWRKV